MPFTPVQRTKVSEQVAEAIREAIVTGRYAPGDGLPAERSLAEQFGVNRSSVREAIHRLEAWGLVEVRQGGGTRVVDFLATAGLHLLPFLLAPGGRLDPALLRDLLDLRVELLGWTAEQAAGHAGADDAAALEATIEALEAAGDPARRQELDYDFFEQLVALSRNRVLGLLANAIRRVYLENRALFLAFYGGDAFDTLHHWACAGALRAGDAGDARAAMSAYGRAALEDWIAP